MERFLIHLICAFIPFKEHRKAVRDKIVTNLTRFKCRMLGWSEKDAERILGARREVSLIKYALMRRRLKKEKNRKFPQYLSLCAIVKNEAPYLPEWIEFYKLVGVEKFYIYDNESSDNTKEVLKPYIDAGDVVYTYQPGQAQQVVAYNDAVKKYKNETKWLGFFDLDEFVMPLSTKTIPEFLKDYEEECGVVIYWLVYGDNGYKTKTDGLVLERFTAHSEEGFGGNVLIKTIANPREIKEMVVHHALYRGGFAKDEVGRIIAGPRGECSVKKIRMNHYFGKSFEEFVQKRNRGKADNVFDDLRPFEDFEHHNRNEIKDDKTAEKYILPIKEALRKKGFDDSGRLIKH